MTSKPSEYTAFLPNTLLTLVNSKAFIPFILSSPSSDQVSLAALAASQHQRHADLLTLPASTTLAEVLAFFRQYDITAVPLVQDAAHSRHKAKAKHSPSSVVGVFSMHDLLRPLIHHPIFDQAPASLFPQPPSASPSSSLPRLSEAEFLSQLSALPVWSSPVLPFMSCNESNRSSWFLLAKQKVGDAAAALSSGLRHVLVLEGDDIHSSHPATVSMLSAGDLARFIYTSLAIRCQRAIHTACATQRSALLARLRSRPQPQHHRLPRAGLHAPRLQTAGSTGCWVTTEQLPILGGLSVPLCL